MGVQKGSDPPEGGVPGCAAGPLELTKRRSTVGEFLAEQVCKRLKRCRVPACRA